MQKIIRSVNNPFLWLVVLLVAAEFLASRIIPYRTHPVAAQVYRNPTPHRAWPEYVKGKKAPGKKLVIFIGDSQAVAREVDDSKNLYTALLQEEFDRQGIPIKIENWSCGGIRTPDIELLSLQAVERRADLLVFVLGYSNFDFPAGLNLDYSSSDINLLAGKPGFWRYLSRATFAKNIKYGDIAKRFTFLHSSLARMRIFLYDALAQMIPKEQHKYIFGYQIEPLIRLDDNVNFADEDKSSAPKHILEMRNFIRPAIREDNMYMRLATFRIFYPLLSRRLKENNIPFIWIWTPVATEIFAEESKRLMAVFEQEAGRMIKGSGVRYLDLTYSIPGKYFLMFNHLDEKGHQIIGNILLPVVIDELQ